MNNLVTNKENEGIDLFIGIDIHLKNWEVSIFSQHLKLKTFQQPPRVEALVNFLHEHYAGYRYKSAYEAGFSGFSAHRALLSMGIDNIIVNPADVPTTDKQKKQKRDQSDSAKLGMGLRSGLLKSIYVPNDYQIHDRMLLRTREQLKKDANRCKQRIKSHLHFLGITIPDEYIRSKGYWKKAFIAWLKELPLTYSSGRVALDNHLLELEHIGGQLKTIDREIIKLAQDDRYNEKVTLLRTIPGISLLSAMIILTEIGDIHRFKRFDELCSYVGLIPNVHASGEKEYVGAITGRSNKRIRRILVESSWWLVRKDPAITTSYETLMKRTNGNRAIIRIARKLLNRIRYVLINHQPYKIGMS